MNSYLYLCFNKRYSFVQRVFSCLFLSIFFLMNQVRATDSPWVFKAPCVGYALKDGGYLWDHGIDALAPSPEFSFPLQLVYSNTMSQKGILGSYWSIPQLDSRILPQDKNWLWTRPDGTVLFFITSSMASFSSASFIFMVVSASKVSCCGN